MVLTITLCATTAATAQAAGFTFVNDPVSTDTPPFLQLLGINNASTIVGYTGIGMVNGNGTCLKETAVSRAESIATAGTTSILALVEAYGGGTAAAYASVSEVIAAYCRPGAGYRDVYNDSML